MQAPKLPTFIKLPNHKRFDFKPRYYNPEEEERKKRLKKHQAMKEVFGDEKDHGLRAQRMRQKMHTSYKRRSNTNKADRNSIFRLVAIILALLLIAYLILSF